MPTTLVKQEIKRLASRESIGGALKYPSPLLFTWVKTPFMPCGCGACGPEVRTRYEVDGPWKADAIKEWNTRIGNPASAVADMRERCARVHDEAEASHRQSVIEVAALPGHEKSCPGLLETHDQMADLHKRCAERIRQLDLLR